jgi:tRNA/rRNA methyltransferase
MKATLLKIGFLNAENPEHILFALRRILGRAGLEDRDVRILSGLFHQIDWIAERDRSVAEKKTRTRTR